MRRRTVRELANALHAAEQACRDMAASGDIEPMKKAVARGVSANLLRGNYPLVQELGGEKGIQFSFTWTPLRGVPADVISTSWHLRRFNSLS